MKYLISEIRHVIDIEQFLEDALNEESKQTLTHLDLSPEPQGYESKGFDEHFVDGWAGQVRKFHSCKLGRHGPERNSFQTEFYELKNIPKCRARRVLSP